MLQQSGIRTAGFTVVELLVALAIAAVMMALAAPAFNGFIAQRNLTAQVNDFVLAVNLARSEAARRGGPVSVQTLDASDDANEWGPGWCVVPGNPGDCTGALRNFPDLGDNTMDATGGLDTITTLTFNSRGLMTLGAAGTVDLCNPNSQPGRQVTVSAIGRMSTQEFVCP